MDMTIEMMGSGKKGSFKILVIKTEQHQEKSNKERLANARNLKALGVSAEIIMQATGLTIEEINELG